MAHSAPTSTARTPVPASEEPSIGTLVQSAMADISTLVRNEIELAKSEIGQSAKKAGVSVAAFAAAGVVAAFAGIFFFVFLALLIAIWLPAWAGFLIVFGLLMFVAGVAGLVGLRFVKRIEKPARTLETLRDLPEVAHRQPPGQRHRDVPVVSKGRVELHGDSYVV